MGFSPKCTLDIGAYEGHWATDYKKIFPDSAILMVEGQFEKESHLIKTKQKYSDVDYKIALLGADNSVVTFNKYETASSVLGEHHETGAMKEIRDLATLDSLVSGTKFSKPDLIKIDTQGYELEILKGGERTLLSAEFVLLEISLLDIYVNCPLVNDVTEFMAKRGFVLYDICSLMRRPLDGTLFQSDFLFIKKDSRFRNDKRWSA
jgi:FkbM family methyltransferase